LPAPAQITAGDTVSLAVMQPNIVFPTFSWSVETD
jgi:hypothetical protein